MADLRVLPTIYKATDTLALPVGFVFFAARDLRVTCVDPCGIERPLQEGRDYTVTGGGEGNADCKPRGGKICLTRPIPDCEIVIEHSPEILAIAPSGKPLDRKEAISAFDRMAARLSMMEHRLSLALSAPINAPCAPVLDDPGKICDDGLWSDDALVEDDGKWTETSNVCDDGDVSCRNNSSFKVAA